MQCKTCCQDRVEKDFECSRGCFSGSCYRCVFKQKGGIPLSALKQILEKNQRSQCKMCGNSFVAMCGNRNYMTNARYCSAECRKKSVDLANKNSERRKIKSTWSFSWRNKNFDYQKASCRGYA